MGATKRTYAHELYPHADEYETRPLSVEVPYLYAQAVGHRVGGTGWSSAFGNENRWAAEAAIGRTIALIEARHKALLADALLQGMCGDEAWAWADARASDEEGEIAWERAVHYGVTVDQIKPYPCGPEPDHHDHMSAPDTRGWQTVTRVKGKESECAECCEADDE